jgi:hypothetical protein
MACAYDCACGTTDQDAGADGFLAAKHRAYQAAGYSAANQPGHNLLGTGFALCIIMGHVLAIALAGGIGLGRQGASYQKRGKGGGENSASGHNFEFLSWTQEPPPAVD